MLRIAAARRFSTTSRTAANGLPKTLTDAMSHGAHIRVNPEVEDALATGKPVVALETTIITHGMPYPTNLETARSCENLVRKGGAIPATIGIMDGRIHVGLSDKELDRFGDPDFGAVKVSRRDIAPAMALGKNGSTTCSATTVISALAGIKFFATGGLGGVHRGGEDSLDISADLPELARCPVGLVSAGVKSILDIGRTLEYLETLGVPVISWGTDEFPAFYSRKSGFKSPWSMSDPAQAARLLFNQWTLGMGNGALFAVPIPEQYETSGEELQKLVLQAVAKSEENGMSKRGKEVTPWLLNEVRQLSGGKSLENNVALIENTSELAGRMAVEYAKLVQEFASVSSQSVPTTASREPIQTVEMPDFAQADTVGTLPSPSIVVFGSAAVDITAQASSIYSRADGSQSTTPGKVSMSLGGVARNIAEAAHRSLPNTSVHTSGLASCVGDDSFGRLLVEETRSIGMRTDGIITTASGSTAVCNMVIDESGGLVGGVADMDIIKNLTDSDLSKMLNNIDISKNPIVAMDANLSSKTLRTIVAHCSKHRLQTFYEPTSVIKSIAIQPAMAQWTDSSRSAITYASPNLLELSHLYTALVMDADGAPSEKMRWNVLDRFALSAEYRTSVEHLARQNVSDHDSSKGTLSFLLTDGVAQMAINLLPFFQHLITKCGDRGVLLAMRVPEDYRPEWLLERSNAQQRLVVARGDAEIVVLKHIPALPLDASDIVNVTGAGDTLVGSLLASLAVTPGALSHPRLLDTNIMNAQKAAILTLKSHLAVSPHLSA
ncbi:unnamed protein product [Peniophora sp. CBMAI 1063]|nr:unnamed protein product [Peniophora sp. CBMAI 1063]